MNILAVYGSSYGQTEAVVRRLVTILERHGHVVAVHKGDAVPSDFAVDDFDAFLIGASIILGRYQRYVEEFARRHVTLLNTRPAAFVSVNGASPMDRADWQVHSKQYLTKFMEKTGWHPRWTLKLAGALRYSRYSLITRWVMRMISRRTGGPTDVSRDYDFTDWHAVDEFGEELCEALSHEQVVSRVG